MAYTSKYAEDNLSKHGSVAMGRESKKVAKKAEKSMPVKKKQPKRAGGGIAERYQKGMDTSSVGRRR